MLDINKNVTLTHVKQHLKVVSHEFMSFKCRNDMEQSKQFWEIKKHNGTPKITWKIIRICSSYNPNSKNCLLCLNEKYKIAT